MYTRFSQSSFVSQRERGVAEIAEYNRKLFKVRLEDF
jgi:hypothetical protein